MPSTCSYLNSKQMVLIAQVKKNGKGKAKNSFQKTFQNATSKAKFLAVRDGFLETASNPGNLDL